jgi:DNA-binding transcriptional LysR family regulator
MEMNRNHLAIFQAVAEKGSFSRAAEALEISQPAVSRQVAELESKLGLRLLDRLPRGTCLTQAGVLLSQYVAQIQALEKNAAAAMAEMRGLSSGRITIGASTTIGAYLLPPLVAEFSRRNPRIEVQIRIDNTQVIQQALLAGDLHIAFTEGFAEDPHLRATVFYTDELVAIVPPGHALLKLPHVNLKQFLAEPLILREPGSGTRAVIESYMSRAGVVLKPKLELTSTEAIKHLVMAGAGVAIVSGLTVQLEIASGQLRSLSLQDCRIHRPLHQLLASNRWSGPAMQAFLKMLAQKRYAAEMAQPAKASAGGSREKAAARPTIGTKAGSRKIS